MKTELQQTSLDDALGELKVLSEETGILQAAVPSTQDAAARGQGAPGEVIGGLLGLLRFRALCFLLVILLA